MNKRDFIKKGVLGLIGVGAALQLKSNGLSQAVASSSKIQFVPFSSESFLHLFSEVSFLLHYKQHYQESFQQTQGLLKSVSFAPTSLRQLFISPSQYNQKLVEKASAYYNHKLFFKQLSRHKNISGHLKINSQIESQFGSKEILFKIFLETFSSMHADGWLWLVQSEGKLKVVTTRENDNPFLTSLPLNKQGFPLIAIDCWEHNWQADYSTKELYLQAVWNNLNWNFIDKRLVKSLSV
ncbi:MAG: hypothetical protein IPM71_04140 [Bacteroidota bacterium]|nr:MAG: hypothetical protein IPM71_04140 [Bacteroidota bacterium]